MLFNPPRGNSLVQAGTWYQVPGKAPSSAFKRPSKRVIDLVRMSICAHRAHRGDIVWACWQPGGAGKEIGDVRRVNSGAMLLMLNPRGADNIAERIDRTAREKNGPMSPWHFDLALKTWLLDKTTNKNMRACYIFPPVGNYTTHTSGCDPTFATGDGRPNCWAENWCCPGTTVAEDPQRRPKRLMSWNGDKGYEEVGSAVVDVDMVGHHEWLSWWQGAGPHPAYREQEERRPQPLKKKPPQQAPPRLSLPPPRAGQKEKGKAKRKASSTLRSRRTWCDRWEVQKEREKNRRFPCGKTGQAWGRSR